MKHNKYIDLNFESKMGPHIPAFQMRMEHICIWSCELSAASWWEWRVSANRQAVLARTQGHQIPWRMSSQKQYKMPL